MKKLVIFTLAMVLVAGAAIAGGSDDLSVKVDDNVVPVAVNALGCDQNANAAAADGNVAQQAFQVNTDLEVDDVLSNNKVTVATGGAQQAGQVAAKDKAQVAIDGGINAKDRAKVGSNFDNNYVVDNAVLANVNVAAAGKKGYNGGQSDEAFRGGQFPGGHDDQKKDECCPSVSQTNTFNKTQHGEIGWSFNGATGVSNANAAGGNLNAQTAYTTIGVAFVK